MEGKRRCFSKIAFDRWDLVGVDVKSHQIDTTIPHAVITRGNEAQDKGCEDARALHTPADVHVTSGGPFAFFFVPWAYAHWLHSAGHQTSLATGGQAQVELAQRAGQGCTDCEAAAR